jgi:hypothetical protein
MLDRHSAGADEETKRLWGLFVFELWHRELVDCTTTTETLEAAA